MTKSMLKAATCLTALSVASSAYAGGLDRATFNPNILFEEGNYFEMSFGNTSPSVGSSAAGPRITVAPSFTTIQAGYKHQVNDKFALAFLVNSNPLGVKIDYANFAPVSAPLSALNATLDTTSLTALGRYQINEGISVYGGVRHTEVSGDANLPALALAGAPETGLTVSGSGTDFIVGAAYEIPKIAFRASLSYESGAELDPSVTGTASGAAYGTGQINAPEAWTLNVQSGIAKDTLAFATVRYADWEGAQVLLPASLGSTQLSSFENTPAISVGVARRINDAFAISATLSYEGSGAEPLSPLAPTNGIKGVSLGGRYTSPNGLETSLGLSYSKRGSGIVDTDNTGTVSGGDLPFSGNKVITLGLKIAKSF